MFDLTENERNVYEFIQEKITYDGYAPSVRDIAAALGIRSTSTVHAYMRRLEEKGYIQKEQGKSRAVKIERKGEPDKMLRVPILGKVAAGVPITAIQTCEGYVDYPASMSRGNGNLFALRVEGESMINAGILDGDIVIVENRRYAEDGEIVVALIDDEATVKRFFREKNRVRLQPENSKMKPIYTTDVVVLGVVIANFRFY
ncbi:MAG: transcriptional repressor LexA [Ruminococcaceae bacterium]|nr:transcriptional repressor LexA [Oscillospiraceae bacterium]MBR2915436.1 transcriptional repressor LexA [Clostridia bacterium]